MSRVVTTTGAVALLWMSVALGTNASAQEPATAPPDSKPADAPAAAPTQAAEPAPAATTGTDTPPDEGAAQPEGAVSTTAQAPEQPLPPPTYQTPATPPPPPPQYPPLATGDDPKDIKEGDWDPWAHVRKQRHDGFFLRLAIGLGGGALGGNDHVLARDEVSASGGGLATNIAIGGALVENLILHADIYQMTLFNPTVYRDGREVGSADRVGDRVGVGQDMRMAGLGIGVTYYFMPINLYLSGSVGLGQAVFEGDRGDTEASDLGLGINAMVGKEWWVGADWGLGVAGQLIMVHVEDEILGNVTGLSFNVLFSATYN